MHKKSICFSFKLLVLWWEFILRKWAPSSRDQATRAPDKRNSTSHKFIQKYLPQWPDLAFFLHLHYSASLLVEQLHWMELQQQHTGGEQREGRKPEDHKNYWEHRKRCEISDLPGICPCWASEENSLSSNRADCIYTNLHNHYLADEEKGVVWTSHLERYG